MQNKLIPIIMILTTFHYRITFLLAFLLSTYSFFAQVDGVDIGNYHFDKVGHFIVFFCLTGLLMKSFGLPLVVIGICGLVYGGGIELIQDQLAHRQGSWLDLLADMTGVLVYIMSHKKLRPLYAKLEGTQ
jgi:VanZ family protein